MATHIVKKAPKAGRLAELLSRGGRQKQRGNREWWGLGQTEGPVLCPRVTAGQISPGLAM